MKNPYSMNDQTVLITGGGTGIGLGIARCMLEAGAEKVILVGRREDVLQEACKELGEKSSYLSQDISKLDEIPSFAQKVVSDHGQPTCLVHNAGVNCKKNIKNNYPVCACFTSLQKEPWCHAHDYYRTQHCDITNKFLWHLTLPSKATIR